MATITTNGGGVRKTTTVDLQFEGYYTENQMDKIPEDDGIYAAFACSFSRTEGNINYWDIKRVIYIGMGTGTDNIHVRVGQHVNSDHPKWKRHLEEGESILYAYAECDKSIVHDVEAALIYKNKPSENDVSKDSYTGDTHLLTVISNGKSGCLNKSITIL